MRIYVLLTELHSKGGIQRYNRQLLVCLRNILVGSPPTVFSLNDANGYDGVLGFAGNRPRFVAGALLLPLFRGADLILVGHVNFAPLIPLLRLLRPRTRVVALAHGVEVEQPLSVLARLGLRCAYTVLCVSESTRRFVVEQQGVEPERTAVLFYGFDLPVSACVPESTRESGRLTLLSVSRLSFSDRYKGIDTTIEALSRLIDRYPEFCYVVVGDGDDRPRLAQLARDRGVEQQVHFTGEVSEAELAEYYEQCDIYVLPSSHEGLGIVYLEAMARGKPVIGVHAGGVPDVVIHEVNGLLVPRGESALVEQALDRLAGDEELRARLGDWGRSRTVPSFSTERMERTAREVLLGQAW